MGDGIPIQGFNWNIFLLEGKGMETRNAKAVYIKETLKTHAMYVQNWSSRHIVEP